MKKLFMTILLPTILGVCLTRLIYQDEKTAAALVVVAMIINILIIREHY